MFLHLTPVLKNTIKNIITVGNTNTTKYKFIFSVSH